MRTSTKTLRTAVFVALFAVWATGGYAQLSTVAAANLFSGLHGSWSGTGIITLGSGDRERIRCRVSYEVDENGSSFRQDLRCASDSYKFEMTSDIRYTNGSLTGNWTELTRRRSGTLFGRAVSGRIEALAETPGFSAFLTMITRGDRQSVKIESKSTEVAEVSISLQRR